MRFEDSAVYTVPMPAKLQMEFSNDKKHISIVVDGKTFVYCNKKSYETEDDLCKAIFEEAEEISVVYEDAYDRKPGPKTYKLTYQKDLGWIKFVRQG